jgi:hypothetical protein
LAWLCAFGVFLAPSPVFAGATSTTTYWYGGGLHPLVITRDGVTYRLIGKQVVEQVESEVTRSYAHADRLGSLRVVTDNEGKVVQSLSYDDYGVTGIAGESSAASFDSMASFYRFQGQEQETFPLAELGIDDPSLAAWLDQFQLYHFPWRDYAAGLLAFTETDPIPTEDSLYAALGASPVNVTDETGGMIEESKYDDDDDENEQARVQDLLKRFASSPEMRFTPKEHELLGKTYLKGRNVIIAEIERYNAQHIELTNLLRNTLYAADAAGDHEERETLMIDFYYFEKWHDDVSDRLEMAEEELEKFEQKNAILKQAWTWSVFVNAFSTNDEALDNDEVMTDLVQSIAISPSPAPSAEAPGVAAREDSPVHRSQAEEDDEKAEYEVKVQHDKKNHVPHGDTQE